MGYVALKRLRWGDNYIEPGEPVPDDIEGRNYQSLLYHGLIGPLKEAAEMPDQGLVAANEQLTAERDKLAEQLAAAAPGSVEVDERNGPRVDIKKPEDSDSVKKPAERPKKKAKPRAKRS